ncbi:hypothetical protein [Fusobacterium sp. SYSU M8D902]|uniref:hypothetical protein n=1 Tax=Fusobacterium sp. SYSU M8D902 TaxID=3159562 RepID=UPI0032E3CC86
MRFNINDLEKYRNKIMKSKKKVMKFDNGYSNIYLLSLIGNNWIFAKRNIIKVKNENWDMFKMEVFRYEQTSKEKRA